MYNYPRLNLDDQQKIDYWKSAAKEFWRCADRDQRRNLQSIIYETLEDVTRYCHVFPKEATQDPALPACFIQYTSGGVDALPAIVHSLEGIVRTGAAPANLGMLSNWVSLLDYSIEPAQGSGLAASLAQTVGSLTQAVDVHLWDSAIVYMAARLAHEHGEPGSSQALAAACALDTNPSRMAARLMTVIEHTEMGPIWWQTINSVYGGSADAPMPEMPIAREIISNKERDHQAWWRYGDEMQMTPQYVWAKTWLTSLTSPSRDATFSTNGLL